MLWCTRSMHHNNDENTNRSNHNNSDRQTVPETYKSDVLVDTAHGSSEGLARLTVGIEFGDLSDFSYWASKISELTYHDIGGMRNNSAEYPGKITTCEGNTSLSGLSIIRLLTWKTLVDHLNNGFK